MIKKKNISQADFNTWKNYIKNPTGIIDKDNNKDVNLPNSYRYRYDLHGFSLGEANKKVKDIILSCVQKKYREILLITGKGKHSNTEKDAYVSSNLSKLRYSVPEFIKSNLDLSQHVYSISEADRKDGGNGAIIIKLRKLQNKL